MRLTERKQIFGKELFDMKQDGFITQEMYDNISKSSNNYYASKIKQYQNQSSLIQKTNIQKPIRSEQEVAERKTSMLLNLGVLFLFLSGLIFATTNWNSMELMGKVSAVIFMGAILAIGSYVADTHFSLKKTGYALWVLMTLYIPIVGVTFAYSLLWSKGVKILEPKSLISVASISFISAIINYLSVYRYKSKFYVWATYATLELALLFISGSLKLDISSIFLLIVLCNVVIVYSYLKISIENYKLYASQYLKFISYIVLTIALIINFKTLDIAYIFAIILLFPILFITSRLLKNKCVEIFSILYLFLKSVIVINCNHIHMTALIIPAIILYLIYYYDYKINVYKETAYISLILSFVLFNISALSQDIFFSVGITGVMITGWIIYNKKQSIKIKNVNIKIVYESLLPIYTYILLSRTPFVLFKNLTELQMIFIMCIASSVLSTIQLIINDKYKNIRFKYSKISMIISILCGLISLFYLKTMIFMIILLSIFQIISVYKQVNKASIIINLIIGINIILKISNNYSESLQCLSIVIIFVLFLAISKLLKEEHKLTIFISSLFLFSSAVVLRESMMVLCITFILGILMMIYTIKTKLIKSLLVFSLFLGTNIFLITTNLLKPEDNTVLLLIMTIYAVILGGLGSICFEKINFKKEYDSLTISGIIILSIISIITWGNYLDIAITTIGSLVLVGLNINKLKESTMLKLFLILRLLLAYIQVLEIANINLDGAFFVTPMLLWTIASRYWIFKNKEAGKASETISLIALNLKSLLFIFNSNILHSIIVITIGVIILIIAYSKKIKAYFITGLIMIIPLFISSTFDFWILIPWWLYLLIFGTILITLGSLAEKQGKKIKEIKNNFFKDWN